MNRAKQLLIPAVIVAGVILALFALNPGEAVAGHPTTVPASNIAECHSIAEAACAGYRYCIEFSGGQCTYECLGAD